MCYNINIETISEKIMTFKEKLHIFKEDLSNSIYLDPVQRDTFNEINDSFYSQIFKDNFNSDNDFAKKVLFNQFNKIDRSELEKQTKRIKNYSRAMKTIKKYIDSGKQIVFVTDTDNDGSLSQSIILEFKNVLPELSKNIHIIYSQSLNGNTSRGFTVDVLERWASHNGFSKDEDFLMLSADNGVNSVEEQMKIEKSFSKCNLIITDHHMPKEDEVIVDTKRTCLFNPKNDPIAAFKGDKNISGAHTLGVLLKNTAINYVNELLPTVKGIEYNEETELQEKIIAEKIINFNTRNFEQLCYISNLLDYVNVDLAFKPLENHVIDKFSSLGALLNVNNSMNKIITGDTSLEHVERIIKNIPEINKDELMDAFSAVEEQNLLAAKLLYIQKEYDEMTDVYEKSKLDKNSFYSDNVKVLVNKNKFTHFNENYIEQLRPRIYHHSVNGEKTEYEVGIVEAMEALYKNVQKIEKRLIAELRKSELMNTVKLSDTTLMYPKYPEINELFNRKFLGKVFNEEINGFLAMFDGKEKSRRTGSCRSLYELSNILSDTKSLPDYLELSFAGHEKAAGYFIDRNDGKTLTDEDMKIVADYMQERIDTLKVDKSYNQKYIHADLNTIDLVQLINKQVKAHVNNVSGINPVIKLNRSMHFTDKKSLKTISIGELLKKEKYGYTLLNLNFHGDTIIVPTEIVRQLSKNNFKDLLQVNFMSDGAFIAYKIVPEKTLKAENIIKLSSPKKAEQEELTKYYEEEFVNKETFEKSVSRDKMKEIDFFKNNSHYGEGDFNDVESFFIGLIDKYTESMEDKTKPLKIVIADTEANGLGKAPKLFNFGAFEVFINPDSGQKIPLDEFMKEYNKNKTYKGKVPLNFKIDIENNEVIINREIQGTLVSLLIRDKDFKLTQEIQDLTGISQTMLNKYGIPTGEADVYLKERYSEGTYIFNAHNSNYDVGVLASNTPQFKEILDKNMVCDTARFAKEERLAYPDTYVATLCPEASKAFFFNDPLADYSISKMLNKDEDIQFPDVRGEYLVKTKGENVFLINTKTDLEIKLPYKKEELAKTINDRNTDLPLNMLKYSVVVLAKFENIRAVVLHDLKESIKLIDTPMELFEENTPDEVEKDPKRIDRLFKEYCKDYHFDCNIRTNLEHFRDAIIMDVKDGTRDMDDILLFFPDFNKTKEQVIAEIKEKKNREKLTGKEDESVSFLETFSQAAVKFLEENKELHLRFATIWEYQKVLNVYDPDRAVKDINKNVLEGVSYNTGLPIERVSIILDKVYAYKKHYNLKDIYTRELHNNINENGDAMIEGLLLPQRLMRKHYNSYAKNKTYASALNIYCKTLEITSQRNLNRQHMEVEIGEAKINSYSQKQMESYSTRRMDGDGNINISPIISNARDPKHTKWQLKCLPPGSFIEANPDEEFILNKLFGKSNTESFIKNIENMKVIDSIDIMKIFEIEIQGKAKKLSPKMKKTLEELDNFDLDYKREEIKSKIIDLSKREVVENLLNTSGINKKLKEALTDILDEEKNKMTTFTKYLERVVPEINDIRTKINKEMQKSFTEEQYQIAKKSNSDFLNTKKMTEEEKSEIERKMIYISKRLKIENSLNKAKTLNKETAESINDFLDATKDVANNYIEEIENRLGAIKFTRSETDIKKVVEQIWDSMQGKGNFIVSANHYKDYHAPFYNKLMIEFKSLGERLGLDFKESEFKNIKDKIVEFKEHDYDSFENSFDTFSRNPQKFIIEEASELTRELLAPQVRENNKMKNNNSVINILGKKKSEANKAISKQKNN